MNKILLSSFVAVVISALGLNPTVFAVEYDPGTCLFIEAESFEHKGGWVLDQQFIDIMGSSILLAHGMGEPLENAKTEITFPRPGTYKIFVRTRNWVADWTEEYAPGIFQLVLADESLPYVYGKTGKSWAWDCGGKVEIKAGELKQTLELKDLSGFDGRVDAVCFSCDENFVPPNKKDDLAKFRRLALALPDEIPDAEGGPFDLVVVGGGMAGTCAAISAARLGLNVALVQDRPMVGGNNSPEVRVHLQGRINLPPYPNLGNLVAQLNHRRDGNAMPADYYENEKKMNLLAAESGVKTFFNTSAISVEMDETHDNNKAGGRKKIAAVIGKNVESGREIRFKAPLFADCTGDGNLGFYAGADWRMGRESKAETGETLAPVVPDGMTMGASVQWYSVVSEDGKETVFPELPWAIQFTHENAKPMIKGDWDWETGMMDDQITDFEKIRDNGLRAAYGHWAYMKNQAVGDWPEKVKNRKLGWVAFIAGKRESRRLLGDVILKEQDITEKRQWPDACVTTTWSIDLHYPTEENSKHFPGEEFRTIAKHVHIEPYAIPYRCLYSRNVENLFMAGRDISVTHVALGTIRVMRTGGMMGEVVGMAASICKTHATNPRGVYENHLDELKSLMEAGIAPPPIAKSSIPESQPKWLKEAGKNLARDAKTSVSGLYTRANYPATNINDGKYDLADNAGRWVSDEAPEHWVVFEWEKPVKINAMRLLSGQAGSGNPITPIVDFSLQIEKDGKWADIPGADVTDNTQCDFGRMFPEIEAARIRLRITGTPGGLARIWEMEFYNIP